MYTVLLVDDEVPILDSLSSSINWQQFGVSTLLTASDGIQALQIMSEQEVHMIITDIIELVPNTFSNTGHNLGTTGNKFKNNK